MAIVRPYESKVANLLSIINEAGFFSAIVVYMWF